MICTVLPSSLYRPRARVLVVTMVAANTSGAGEDRETSRLRRRHGTWRLVW